MENPLVSIIIPTYRRADKLPKAINSILNQTYSPIEIIVVDDNGELFNYKESTHKIVQKYIDNNQITYLQHKNNKGGGGARNTGIRHANGDYIGFLDDDDFFEETKIEKQVQLFKNSKISNLGLVYSRRYSVKEDGKIYKKDYAPLVRGQVFEAMLIHNYVSTPVALAKRECFELVGVFDESLPSRQDHDMFLRISKYYSFDYIDEHLVGMLVHKERISRNLDGKKKGWSLFIDKWQTELSSYPHAYKKVLFNYYWELSKIYYINKEFRKARKYAWKSYWLNVSNLKPAIILLFSTFKIKLNIS